MSFLIRIKYYTNILPLWILIAWLTLIVIMSIWMKIRSERNGNLVLDFWRVKEEGALSKIESESDRKLR